MLVLGVGVVKIVPNQLTDILEHIAAIGVSSKKSMLLWPRLN
jgi:hypothetical protein